MGNKQNIPDQVVPLLLLLQTTERHLGTWNVLLWVLKVLEQGGFIPNNTLLLVGIGVLETSDLARFTAKESVQVRANFVGTTLLESVALLATGLEKVGTLGNVSCKEQLC